MRKSVKIAMIAATALATVLAVPFGLLSFWWWHKTAQIESFYREHRLLHEMHAVQDNSTNDSGPAREALLQMLPLETDRDIAVAALRKEGFNCHPPEAITDSQLRERFVEARSLAVGRTEKQWVECLAGAPNVVADTTWIVKLEFNAEAHLSDARVAIWNIFL